MSCPGGALFFQPLGPEIPSAENLLKITPNNCGLVHIKLRRAGARARAYSATIWVGRARRSGWRVSVAAR
ncbi:hypothetical protein DXU06_12015 [Bradyrhizobium elkanii]|nr:hypothetical protein [Bradyrhizobium elkanii]RYM22778.1 hypothetical protein EWH13_26950 [Bradyrhizobium elkanii]